MTRPATNGGRYALPRPFLKWVGGKGQLLPELVKRVEAAGAFGRYHEPFVGGGALFFELHRTGRLKRKAVLSDANPNLVNAYTAVRDEVDAVIRALQRHKSKHSEDHYYAVRAKVPRTPAAQAARLIYLNKTGYNGLYRENRKGEYNVPFGRYKNPAICDEDNLRSASRALQSAAIDERHFETVLDKAKPGDLVYFDPPYHPVSKTASFTSYAQHGFAEDSQRLLARVAHDLTANGVHILLSNSMTPFIRELYASYHTDKGVPAFTIEEVQATRAINSRPDRRGKIPEALIRNF